MLLVLLVGAAPADADNRDWHYGGFADLGYAVNSNQPDNHRWRSKDTTPRTGELAPNMGLVYLSKDAQEASRWGMELAFQGGYDTEALVPEGQPGRDEPMGGADVLRHIARANVQYLAPVGRGLLLTAGLMQGYIAYESFYARNNANYTRAYLTDFSPNFMLGVGARYELTPSVDVGLHIMNGYEHLSHPNSQPSYGVEVDWRLAPRTTFAQNFYYGPDQRDTDLRYWRLYSSSQLMWRNESARVGAAFDVGTEEAAELPGAPRTFWMGAAVFARYELAGPWSVGARPELFWDRNGRMSEAEQLLMALTSTVQYSRHAGPHWWIARLEHRYDRSTGADGGFYRKSRVTDGDPALARDQHLLLLSIIYSFDS